MSERNRRAFGNKLFELLKIYDAWEADLLWLFSTCFTGLRGVSANIPTAVMHPFLFELWSCAVGNGDSMWTLLSASAFTCWSRWGHFLLCFSGRWMLPQGWCELTYHTTTTTGDFFFIINKSLRSWSSTKRCALWQPPRPSSEPCIRGNTNLYLPGSAASATGQCCCQGS